MLCNSPGGYLGELKQGPVWDRLLREYYAERVFVDIDVARTAGQLSSLPHRLLAWRGAADRLRALADEGRRATPRP